MFAFAADAWHNYSVPFPIRDAVPADEDGVWLATEGGVRYRDSVNDYVFTPANGLEASNFYGIANTPIGVYAVSEYGLIARMNDDFASWKVLNRSFAAGNVRVVPGMVEYADGVLVIAFENKVAFIDLESGRSIISVDHIGDVVLSVYGPEKIEIRGDSLYVSTLVGTLARRMDWKHLADDVRLVDPETWKRVKNVCLHCRDSLKVVVDGVTLKDPLLYSDGKSSVLWQFKEGDKTYLVGREFVATYSKKKQKLTDLTDYIPFKLNGAYVVQAIPEGGVIAASVDGYMSVYTGKFWYDPVMVYLGYPAGAETYNYRLKNLSILPRGFVVAHIWGTGLHLYWSLGQQPFFDALPGVGNCLSEYDENFSVVVGTTVAPDGSGFLAATSAPDRYGIDFLSPDANLSCASEVGSHSIAGPMAARLDSATQDWIVYVSYRTEGDFSAFSSGGLDIVRFPSPSKNGGRLLNPELKTLEGLEGNTLIDMAVDEENEVLWFVTATGIGYVEFDRDTIRKPLSINGMLGAEYTSIDVDPHGNIWVGTAMQGIYRLERRNGSFDTLSATHFTMVDGLLNNMVLDLSIDKKNGAIWAAHENGVTSYHRNDLRRAKTFMTDSADAEIKVYPIPFNPHLQRFLTIDHISEDARVDIYNRGGSLIRSFAGDEVAGGRLEWDGKGKNDRYVTPGVYFYVVRTSSKVKRGKFIIKR
ncbi:MAG: gliding motility-associated C-terminal domain-containing protein [Fibrobacter sp.]|uniref:T9SS type A sorting domain-containing protein n=1 Tax=Fibrobacter sp. TaxID=35828 RepID=UPI0025BB0AAE|nr:gliding motility-associated C-terminal domain-containing protein [Fibrobacter sp.]MBR4784768.1 gliding motility-associated C-terminal domain-containing protein [Fibrobacter sp.]